MRAVEASTSVRRCSKYASETTPSSGVSAPSGAPPHGRPRRARRILREQQRDRFSVGRPPGACEKSSELRQPFRATVGAGLSPGLRGARALRMWLPPGNANLLIGAVDVEIKLPRFRRLRKKRTLLAVGRPGDVVFLMRHFSVARADSLRRVRRA